MRQFLSAVPAADRGYEITIGTSSDAVARGGLISPVFSAYGGDVPTLSDSASLLLCFPSSPHDLLRTIQNDLSREIQARTMVSYGLAAVLLVGEADELRELAQAQRDHLLAYELWPLEKGLLIEPNVERFIRVRNVVSLVPIGTTDLPYDAACQVRQLNASLAFALHRAEHFAPELAGALRMIAASAGRLVEDLRVPGGQLQGADDVRKHHYYLARVLEISAGLAMVVSQTFSGVPPLLSSDYPVGEYGLLGVGSASRALWSFYHHLRRCFVEANHATRLHDLAGSTVAFDPFLSWRDLDYSSWDTSPARLTELPKTTGLPPAPHLLHFSSRFGFHETAYTLGASWQSLHASSSRDWHLLTVTHEYIHSQVRQLTSAIFPDDTDWERLAELYRGKKPENARESLQLALTQAMQHYESGRIASSCLANEAEAEAFRGEGYIDKPTAGELRNIVAEELRYFQEIVVHVLDFLYTFHGDAKSYVAAIWQSWSTVPSVTERIPDYLLRTLCAVASGSVSSKSDDDVAFNAAYEPVLVELRLLAERFESPVVALAVEYLDSEIGKERLETEFSQAFYSARLTRTFFYDAQVATALRADDLTRLGEDGARRYRFEPGEYPEDAIASPLNFLSDRFEHETMDAGPALEFASLWQLLLLIDPERKDW